MIRTKQTGNVYTTGYFSGTSLNFDPNSTSHQLSSSHSGNDSNAYVSMLNSNGQYVFGFGGNAYGRSVAVDASGNVYEHQPREVQSKRGSYECAQIFCRAWPRNLKFGVRIWNHIRLL